MIATSRSKGRPQRFSASLQKDLPLWLFCLPALALVAIFHYVPMWGALIAFQSYSPAKGIFRSTWVGFLHFSRFFRDPYFFRIVRNTLLLGIYSLAIGFPAPIILALLLNEVRNRAFKKVTQTISYMPYFLSTVIIVGILKDLMSITDGKINEVIKLLGGTPIYFFVESEWFRFIYISSGIWQSIGFSSIIYLAALAGIDVELYEAAVMDGAGRARQLWHVTLPGMLPTIVILLILSVGGIVSNDYTKVLLIYNAGTYETADVIGTYVYRAGIEGGSLSYSTAVGLLQSIIAFALLYVTNKFSKSMGDIYLW
jgi:putative aldouronate transport system permease protein